jgi:integrase
MASLIHEPQRPRKPWRVDWFDEWRKRRTSRFKSRAEAEIFIGQRAAGERAAQAQPVLEDWIATWVLTHGPEWAISTLDERSLAADALILPTLGRLRIDEITRLHIREWRSTLLQQGVTPYRANRTVSILSAALGAAVDDDLLFANPCRGLKKLPETPSRRTPATLDEVERIRAAMRGENAERNRAVVSLLAYAGLRPSEVSTLAWDDVFPATLVVRSARGPGGAAKGTKTGSVRSVPLIPALRQDLDALKRSGPLVIGELNMDNWRNRSWNPARRLIGASVSPYDCRHTFASLLIAERRTAHEVALLLGHSTPALTLKTYGHVFAEAQLRPGEPMGDAVARARQAVRAIP